MSDSSAGPLETQISAALKQAGADQDWAVAELLLQALEAIAARDGRNDHLSAREDSPPPASMVRDPLTGTRAGPRSTID